MHGKILIADDERLTRNGIVRSLSRWAGDRYDVLTAENGWTALQLLREHRWAVDLLITDIRMPSLDGLQLIRYACEEGARIPAIVLTGYADFEYARTALRYGAVRYLLKPAEEEHIVQAVEEGLERASSEQRQAGERSDDSNAEMGPRGAAAEGRAAVSNPFIRQAVDYIDHNLNRMLPAKNVAGLVHLNVSYFSVLFKNETGVSFSDYVTKRRLQKAKELLVRTNLMVYEIAEQTGYQSASYFVKVFQEAEGMTPKMYRNTHR
ncbi:response regulator [Paenibacillus chartarius]|uniref:Response regulator n=1 Tax=Paenibacillus chartarius TaxID=747481 RepID=A0ABV6DHA0_9BACL